MECRNCAGWKEDERGCCGRHLESFTGRLDSTFVDSCQDVIMGMGRARLEKGLQGQCLIVVLVFYIMDMSGELLIERNTLLDSWVLRCFSFLLCCSFAPLILS